MQFIEDAHRCPSIDGATTTTTINTQSSPVGYGDSGLITSYHIYSSYFLPWCGAITSAKYLLLWHYFLSKAVSIWMDIFLNQLIQFYSNNATNLHHLTSYSRLAVLFHSIETALRPPQITVTSLNHMCTLTPVRYGKIGGLLRFASAWLRSSHDVDCRHLLQLWQISQAYTCCKLWRVSVEAGRRHRRASK